MSPQDNDRPGAGTQRPPYSFVPGLFPHPRRRHLLQPVYGRVIVKDIVPDLRLGNRAAHLRSRPRDGIAP